MLFSCGIAVGVYGVAEPLSYYRGGWGEHNLAGREPLATTTTTARSSR